LGSAGITETEMQSNYFICIGANVFACAIRLRCCRTSVDARAYIKSSQHLYAFHVDGIAFDVSGDGYMMAFVTLKRVCVVDGQDFVVTVGDHDRGGSAFETFLGAGGSAGVGTLGAAFGVTDPAIHGLGFAHIVGCDYGHQQKQHGKSDQNYQQFLHG
jgi:hypothetical protein